MFGCCKTSKDGDELPEIGADIVTVCLPPSRPQIIVEMEIIFSINGNSFSIKPTDNIGADTSLNTFIRTHAKLPGTKFMCLEGGCGVCIVSLRGVHPVTKVKSTWAVNSCLYPVYACHGLEVITIEGIGNKKDGYHDLQKRLAKFNGTQCGFCSPGMVMNMYSLLEGGEGSITMEAVENSFGGNICRCTGYRPILDAFKSVAVDATQELKDVCGDIEDFAPGKICGKTGKACAGLCDKRVPVQLNDAEGKKWYKVYSLPEVFDTFKKLDSNSKYMLVNGNTAHGVFRRSPDIDVFIDVNNVDELHRVSYEEQLTLGGNVSLTETMNALLKVANRPNFEYCKHVWKHFDLIANVPVRNTGTLAGNLSIKHAHKDFPSDVFLLFETVGASFEITDMNGGKQIVKPSDYLSVNMKMKILSSITMPPLPPNQFIFRSFKIMPRAQNAHAYVNAGFLMEVDANNVVKKATVVYGGITPEFIHAGKTEEYLVGKDLFADETLTGVKRILDSELDPDWVLPDASPEYRKKLAIALFYKFILSACPDTKLKPTVKSGGPVLERPLSSGKQDFDTYEKNWPLTQNVPKLEATIQCAGEAQYANDLPPQPHELWAAFVQATEVGAKIVKIDPANALKIPGVHHFFSAADIPGTNSFMTKLVFAVFEDEEIFAEEDVKYNGQPVGIILADSFDLAHKAAEMVKLTYGKRAERKILPTMFDVYREGAADRVVETPFKTQATKVGVNGTRKIQGRFEMGSQYHFTMEPQTTVCVPGDEGLNVYSATQWMDMTQIVIADALNIPNNMVNVYSKRLGGGYGSKISRACLIACACALGAHLTNRPVRFVLKLEHNMEAIGKRPSVISDYEVEVDDNGKIQKLINNYSEDYGCSINEPVIFGTHEHFPNCYRKEVMTFDGKAVVTDSPSSTWCRAPGTTEGIAMIENIMEHVARAVGKDPVQVRLENMPEDLVMKKLLPDFVKDIEYDDRRKAITAFNESNRWRKRGLAVVPMQYHMEYFGTIHVLVSIYHGDGTVSITHGGIEMGQGINTKVAQVAAHTLGVPLDSIALKQSNSLTSANDIVTGGSMASEAVCYAVKKACEALLERLEPVKEKNKGVTWAQLVHAAYNDNVDLISSFLFKKPDVTPYKIWGIAAAEIEIDLLTGNNLLTRVDILEDTGESLSPGIDIGQVEGAFVMGLGYWLQEQLTYDSQDGKLLTNRTWNYKPPTVKDIPVDFRIKFLQKSSNPYGVLRSKATGEPATCMSVVVLFAMRDALDAARKDAGITEPWYPLNTPATVESVFLNSAHNINNFVLN